MSVTRTRLEDSKVKYGFNVVSEEAFDKYVSHGGQAEFWIEDDRIYIIGVDSGGYDACNVPIDAKQARAIADLLKQLADDLESKKYLQLKTTRHLEEYD